jgi:hypothetical protein
LGALQKFLALGSRKQHVLVRTAIAVTWARVETQVVPFRRIAQSLEHAEFDNPTGRDGTFDEVEAVGWSIGVLADRLPWCGNCLAQAVATKRYLNRLSIPSTLFLGVTTSAPQTGDLSAIEAHAWIECGGQILTGQTDDEYKIVYSQS